MAPCRCAFCSAGSASGRCILRAAAPSRAPPNKSGVKALFADSADPCARTRCVPRASWTVGDRRSTRAEIAVASLEPGDYAFVYDLELDILRGRGAAHRDASRPPGARPPRWCRYAAPPHGTVVLLHGYLQNRDSMTPWAIRARAGGLSLRRRRPARAWRVHGKTHLVRRLRVAGYLRRHRRPRASRLGRVARRAARRVVRRVGRAADRGPRSRAVSTVVAFEPFASAERATPELMRAAFAREAAGNLATRSSRPRISSRRRIGGFDWRDADIPAALARTRRPCCSCTARRTRGCRPITAARS